MSVAFRKGNNGLTRTKYLTFGIHADSMKQALLLAGLIVLYILGTLVAYR